MPPSRSKGTNTRSQPKALYLVAASLFCVAVTVSLSLEYDLPWINQALALLPTPHYVHWRTRTEADAECARTRKPILYVVTTRRDSASMLFESQCLGDPAVAELMNDEFIPVRYVMNPKKRSEDKDPDLTFYRDKLGMAYFNTPWITSVPYCLRGASSTDLASSANLVELGVTTMENLDNDQPFTQGNYDYPERAYHAHGATGRYSMRRGGATSCGYSDKQDFLDFLYSARVWHKLPPTVGRIKWMDLDKLDLNAKHGKPKLIAMVSDVGSSSDSMRLNLFWKNSSVDLINEKFEPYLVEFRRQDPGFNKKFAALRAKHHISELPALIVVNPADKSGQGPQVEHGFNSVVFSVDFLKASLGDSVAKMHEASHRASVKQLHPTRSPED
ncbi:MAG: hypothetical protein JSS83_21450 [Cyanobacteria bacterium SZAS LIN-3]|nr:hypothetical protein [Cyanobacteria bacterium SZAS LIN-3]